MLDDQSAGEITPYSPLTDNDSRFVQSAKALEEWYYQAYPYSFGITLISIHTREERFVQFRCKSDNFCAVMDALREVVPSREWAVHECLPF